MLAWNGGQLRVYDIPQLDERTRAGRYLAGVLISAAVRVRSGSQTERLPAAAGQQVRVPQGLPMVNSPDLGAVARRLYGFEWTFRSRASERRVRPDTRPEPHVITSAHWPWFCAVSKLPGAPTRA
jgi:hypothetical protein